ncbi:MAG: energy transducer TonB [Ignavibacteriales bacterium]|nr:energy transducer TonB [Ignavibacteriales bacterium]MCB9209005.1 energy transducer TonB [Ignavibacteriales bacterium]MCB9218073.1 energy transducer TonB [Ignavibacteriales bacterium]
MPPKNPKFNIKLKYQKVFEVSLVFALILIIGAFRYFPNIKTQTQQMEFFQELIEVDDIISTHDNLKPPTPPKPPIPIEAPVDDQLTDIEINNTEIDYDANMTKPQLLFEEDNSEEFDIFIPIAEIMPEPIGGIQAIQQKIIYPEIAKRAGIQGKVFITAFVDEKGDVKKAEITKGIGASCDETALEAVLNTKFKPGFQRERPVKVKITIPISFRLK